MPDEDENFGGSLVLDFRKSWRHVKTIYIAQPRTYVSVSKWFFLHECEAKDV